MKNLLLLFLFLSISFKADDSCRRIKGTIYLGMDGGEAIGAHIILEDNHKHGTLSEFDGTFSLVVPCEAKLLRISYPGHHDSIVPIEFTGYINITLREDKSYEFVDPRTPIPRKFLGKPPSIDSSKKD